MPPASSAPSTACSGARGRRRRASRSTRSRDVIDADPRQPGLAPPHRLGLEPRRHPEHGARAVPRPVPVLRRRRQALVPALPAQRRHVPRRAVQHRQLRAAHPHGRRRRPASRSATSSGPAATATSTTTTSSRSPSSSRREPVPAADLRDRPRSATASSTTSSSDFVVEDYQHHPAIRGAVAV